MHHLSSPCGVWRLTVRRLGVMDGRADQFGVLARIEADGTVTMYAAGANTEPGIGGWCPAGPGRLVVVTESFIRVRAGQAVARLTMRAAAELTEDGRSCRARLQWQRIDLDGLRLGIAVRAEAEGTRLAP